MGVEIDLVGQVFDSEFCNVLFDQGDGDDQRYQVFVIVIYYAQQVLLVAGIKVLFEKAHDVVQDVDVFPDGGFEAEGIHKQLAVSVAEIGGGVLFDFCHELSEFGVVGSTVGEDEEFLRGMEFDRGAAAVVAGEDGLEAMIGEHAGDEVLADADIVKAAFILDREQGVLFHDGVTVQSNALVVGGMARFFKDFHALNAATGRFGLEDVAREVMVGQLFGAVVAVAHHAFGPVFAGLSSGHAGVFGIADQPDGFAGDAHAEFDLGADRDEVKVVAEQVGDEAVAFVSAVVADILAQEAGADADIDGVFFGLFVCHDILPNILD